MLAGSCPVQRKEKEREEGRKGRRKGGEETGKERGRESKKKEGRKDPCLIMLVVGCSTVFLKVTSNVFIQHVHSHPYCFDSSAG